MLSKFMLAAMMAMSVAARPVDFGMLIPQHCLTSALPRCCSHYKYRIKNHWH
jgi:aromatic ring hydroxylase